MRKDEGGPSRSEALRLILKKEEDNFKYTYGKLLDIHTLIKSTRLTKVQIESIQRYLELLNGILEKRKEGRNV